MKQLATPASELLLRGDSTSLDSKVGREFIADCARFTEELLSEGDILSKWGLDRQAWERLGKNVAVLIAVQREREKRVAAGIAAKEAARKHYSQAPNILAMIMRDDAMPSRQRIEAARELRAAAAVDDSSRGPSGEQFTVVININGEKQIYELGECRREWEDAVEMADD
jgi:hypothetical protein